MTPSSDDPRLTAYALGDLDETERAEFERELERSPELRAEVEAIRRLAGRLGEALRAEPAPEFSEVVVGPVQGRSEAAAVAVAPRRSLRWRFAAEIVLAASLLLVLGSLLFPARQSARQRIAGVQAPESPIEDGREGRGKGEAADRGVATPPTASDTPLDGFVDVYKHDAGASASPLGGASAPDATVENRPASRQPEPNVPPAAQAVQRGGVVVQGTLDPQWETKTKEVLVTEGLTVLDDVAPIPPGGYLDPATRKRRDEHGDGAAVGRTSPDLFSSDLDKTRSIDHSVSGQSPPQQQSERPSQVIGKPGFLGGEHDQGEGVPAASTPSDYDMQDDVGYIPPGGYLEEAELDMALRQDPVVGPKYQLRDQLELELSNRASILVEPEKNSVYRKRQQELEQAEQDLQRAKDERRVARREHSFNDPSRWRELTERRKHLGSEAYDTIVENPFRRVSDDPLSTFSIDVDTASYSNVRRFLTQRTLPPRSAVRIEEMVNYFGYDYPQPEGEEPFAVHLEAAGCPWAPTHRLVRVALKGREIEAERRPPSNLVFLVDVSGSMADDNKLPLVKQGLRMLTERLREDDRVAIVTYAGNSGVALPSTHGEQKSKILEAIDALQSGGSTNGASGIELAYALAVGHFIEGGTNRVILCTDGDFNVGVTDRKELTDLIEKKAASGVFLSVLGFGMGNLKDNTLETLADKGNGVYAYIDGEREAHKVLVEELSGTLVTIAKDVKLQLEFNPARVAGYRLLGYENRVLAHEDFNDDRKDAGDIGAGHTVTAFYEIVPVGGEGPVPGVDPLKYQQPAEKAADGKPAWKAETKASDELLTVKLRYKQPDGLTSKLLEAPLKDEGHSLSEASREFRFAAAVVEFGLLLRDSAYRGQASLEHVLSEAEANRGPDAEGHRREFLELVQGVR